MTLPREHDLSVARARARRAWRRAAEATARSARFDRLVTTASPELRTLFVTLAASSRRAAEMHAASARLQTAWAERIENHLGRLAATVSLPRFLAAVADVVGADSAAVVLWTAQHTVAAAMATDEHARSAVDVELMVGEGPAHATALAGGPLVARATDVAERWPVFAQATAAHPLTVVAAAPLQCPGGPIGALTVFDPPWTAVDEHLGDLQTVAGAVVDSLAREVTSLDRSSARQVRVVETAAESPLLAEDWMAAVNQAAGMVAAQSHCDPATALAMIRARAFAVDTSCAEVARRVLAHELRLDD